MHRKRLLAELSEEEEDVRVERLARRLRDADGELRRHAIEIVASPLRLQPAAALRLEDDLDGEPFVAGREVTRGHAARDDRVEPGRLR